MNKLLNNLLGMYKQAKLNKKAESYKSKVAELLNDINEPSPIMDYISESEAEEICKEIGIPHEASWYKGDLFGYIDEVPDGMVDVLIEHISEEDAESLWRRIAHDMGMDVDAKKQTKMSKKAEEKESAKKDYTEQYAKVKEIMKEYGYGLSDGGYIYLISKEQPKDEGFQVKFKGDRLRVELDGKLKYSGYGPEAIEDFLKGMFYAKKLSSKNTKLTKKAYHMEQEDLIKETNEEIKELARNFTNGFKNSWMGMNVKGSNFYAFTTIEKEDEDGFTYLDINNGEFSDGYGLDKYFHPYDYWYDIKNDELYKINWNILEKKLEEDAKFYTSSSKAKVFKKLCLKRAFHKTAGEFEEMMKLKSTDPKLISYLAKEFGVEESTVSQYTDVSENAEELYNILEQQANKYGYEWDKFEYDEYGDRIDEDDFRGDPDDLEKAVEYLKNNIDKSMFKLKEMGVYQDDYFVSSEYPNALIFSINEKLIPTETPVIYITNNTKNYDIDFFAQSKKSKEEDETNKIYVNSELGILIRRANDEIAREIVNYVNVELPKKIEEQNKKQSSKNSIKAEKNNNLFNSKYKTKIEIVDKKYNEIQTKIIELNDKLQKTDDFEEGEKILKEIETLAQQRDKIGEEQNQLYAEWYKEKTKQEKQSSKTKLVRKQAKNKEIVVTYEGTNGKEYIVKAPNGLYFNEYVDTDTQHSRGAGPFETLEKAKEMFKKHRPSAKEIIVTKKKAVLQESENGLGYVLPNGQVVYPGDEEYLKSEYKANKKMLEEDKKELERLESIIKKYPDINFDKNRDSVKFQIPRVKKGIEYLQLFNETIEDILNAFKNKKMGKQATIKHENGVYNVYSESGKCLGKGYKTKEEAEKRLKQVEYFKHKSSLKQVVISKMAKSLKDIPDSVKKNILSDLVYVILTGKGSFAYKTVAKKLETIIKELGYGDRLKANEDGSLPTNEIVELISKEPKAMELAGKFANITRAF